MTDIIDLTKNEKSKNVIEFEPMNIPVYESSEDARRELSSAEGAYMRYRKMLPLIRQLDAINDDISINTPEMDFLTDGETDFQEELEHTSIDAICYLKDHLAMMVAKMKKYCDDIENEAELLEAYEGEERQYGSYNDQVGSLYNSTRGVN